MFGKVLKTISPKIKHHLVIILSLFYISIATIYFIKYCRFFILLLSFTIILVSLKKQPLMMRKKALLSTLILLLSTLTFSQSTDSAFFKSMSAEVMSNAKAYENLRFICKKIGSRLSGSPQAQKAVEATFKMLKDAGADTVY